MTFDEMTVLLEGATMKLESMQTDATIDNTADEKEQAQMQRCHSHLRTAVTLMIDAKKHRNARLRRKVGR